jgi:hypothetical protein
VKIKKYFNLKYLLEPSGPEVVKGLYLKFLFRR